MKNNKKYNVIIIGGGPAGMMAAISAAENGASVALLDRNDSLGKKLLMTGGGRCNFTQSGQNIKELISHYTSNGKFLFSAFSSFSPDDVMNFFQDREVKLSIESGRVFPASGRSGDILDVLQEELNKLKIDFLPSSLVKEFVKENTAITSVKLFDGENIVGDNFIICVGGMSYPSSGSTGDGYSWLKKLGHNIISPRPALTPLRLSDNWIPSLSGVSLTNVGLIVKKAGKIVGNARGEILFTHTGLSGPATINLSAHLDLSAYKYSLLLDLFPDEKVDELFKKLIVDFSTSKTVLKNYWRGVFPQKFIIEIFSHLKIAGDQPVNSISHKEIRRLVEKLKEISMSFSGVFGFDRAMVTAGGVDVLEIDPKTMQSKIVSNLFLAGEIIDITGETGGYNLQLCWSTGYLAGKSAAILKK